MTRRFRVTALEFNTLQELGEQFSLGSDFDEAQQKGTFDENGWIAALKLMFGAAVFADMEREKLIYGTLTIKRCPEVTVIADEDRWEDQP